MYVYIYIYIYTHMTDDDIIGPRGPSSHGLRWVPGPMQQFRRQTENIYELLYDKCCTYHTFITRFIIITQIRIT